MDADVRCTSERRFSDLHDHYCSPLVSRRTHWSRVGPKFATASGDLMAGIQQHAAIWKNHPGVSLLGHPTPRYSPVILLKSDAVASSSSRKLQAHAWVTLGRPDTSFRSRCPHCGVVREYQPEGASTLVTYSSYGELVARGELGHVETPACAPKGKAAAPPEWDVLGLG